MAKVEVTNVEIKVGENKFNLTIKEVGELKKILNDVFPDKQCNITRAPYVIPQPYYIETIPYPRWHDWEITWGSYTGDDLTGRTLCLSTGGTAG